MTPTDEWFKTMTSRSAFQWSWLQTMERCCHRTHPPGSQVPVDVERLNLKHNTQPWNNCCFLGRILLRNQKSWKSESSSIFNLKSIYHLTFPPPPLVDRSHPIDAPSSSVSKSWKKHIRDGQSSSPPAWMGTPTRWQRNIPRPPSGCWWS